MPGEASACHPWVGPAPLISPNLNRPMHTARLDDPALLVSQVICEGTHWLGRRVGRRGGEEEGGGEGPACEQIGRRFVDNGFFADPSPLLFSPEVLVDCERTRRKPPPPPQYTPSVFKGACVAASSAPPPTLFFRPPQHQHHPWVARRSPREFRRYLRWRRWTNRRSRATSFNPTTLGRLRQPHDRQHARGLQAMWFVMLAVVLLQVCLWK